MSADDVAMDSSMDHHHHTQQITPAGDYIWTIDTLCLRDGPMIHPLFPPQRTHWVTPKAFSLVRIIQMFAYRNLSL
jgi:hypothetical protein